MNTSEICLLGSTHVVLKAVYGMIFKELASETIGKRIDCKKLVYTVAFAIHIHVTGIEPVYEDFDKADTKSFNSQHYLGRSLLEKDIFEVVAL